MKVFGFEFFKHIDEAYDKAIGDFHEATAGLDAEVTQLRTLIRDYKTRDGETCQTDEDRTVPQLPVPMRINRHRRATDRG